MSSSGDWPYDPDGEQGSEGMRKYGLAMLSKLVDEDEDFPLDRDAFVDAHGDEPVRINYRRVVSVADIFEYVDADTFETKVDFNRAAGKAMRRGNFWDFQPTRS